MRFLKNVWYAAAWSSEVGRQLLPRTIAGEHVVLYRSSDDAVVALSDTCPHRFAPMHMGTLIGDAIQCPYHGLRFGPSGNCVHNPHGRRATPRAVHLTHYLAIERDTMVWLWLGDPDVAEPDDIPRFPQLLDERHTFTGEHVMFMPLASELIVDNLLDLSHAAFIHPTTLGAASVTNDVTSVVREGSRLWSNRLVPDSPAAGVFVGTSAAYAGEHVDYWADMRWDPPGTFYLDAGITEPGGERERGRFLSSLQIVVPSTETSSMYFWKMFRNYRRDDEAVTAGIEAAVNQAFRDEDEPMIAAVQKRMDGREFWSMRPVLLSSDSAAVQARRIVTELLKAEQTATEAIAAE